MSIDFEDYQAHLLAMEKQVTKARDKTNPLIESHLRQTAREMIVHPSWQPFVDLVQGAINVAKSSIEGYHSLFGRLDISSQELEKVRLSLMYQKGVYETLTRLLADVKRLTEQGGP